MTIHQPITTSIDAQALDTRRPLLRNRAERTFDLHPAVFAMLAGTFALFLAVLGFTFMNAELILPFAIFGIYLTMAFAVPAMWDRVAPKSGGRMPSWAEFMEEGVQTGSGHLTAPQALAQILTLPTLLVGWALAISAISAAV